MRQEELLEIALEQERTLYRVARTLLRSDADCADAVQDTLLKAAAHAHRLRVGFFVFCAAAVRVKRKRLCV